MVSTHLLIFSSIIIFCLTLLQCVFYFLCVNCLVFVSSCQYMSSHFPLSFFTLCLHNSPILNIYLYLSVDIFTYLLNLLQTVCSCVCVSRCCRRWMLWRHCGSKITKSCGRSKSPSSSCLLTGTATISCCHLNRSSSTWKLGVCLCVEPGRFSCTRIH